MKLPITPVLGELRHLYNWRDQWKPPTPRAVLGRVPMRAAQGNDCVEMIHCVNSTLDLTWVAFPLVMVFVGLTGCASGGPSNPFTGARPVGSVFRSEDPRAGEGVWPR